MKRYGESSSGQLCSRMRIKALNPAGGVLGMLNRSLLTMPPSTPKLNTLGRFLGTYIYYPPRMPPTTPELTAPGYVA